MIFRGARGRDGQHRSGEGNKPARSSMPAAARGGPTKPLKPSGVQQCVGTTRTHTHKIKAASPGPPLQLRPSMELDEMSLQDLEGTCLVCVLWLRALPLCPASSQATVGF